MNSRANALYRNRNSVVARYRDDTNIVSLARANRESGDNICVVAISCDDCDCDIMRSRIRVRLIDPLPRFSFVFSPSFSYIPDGSIRLWWNRRLQFRSYKDLFDNWVTWLPKTFAFLIPNYRYCNWRGFQNAVLSVSVATTDRMKYKRSNVSDEFFGILNMERFRLDLNENGKHTTIN